MKKIPFPAILGSVFLILICFSAFAYGYLNLNSRYETLQTQASLLEEDNSKLKEDNAKLNTELTDEAAELQEKEKYAAGQKEYISELSEQIDAFTNDDKTDDGSTVTDTDDQTTNSPSDTDDGSTESFPDLYAEGCNPKDIKDEKVVYLTFDDGPSDLTPKVLDLLDQYNAKATFFVVQKNNEDCEQYLSEIVKRGHTLGLHSYCHNYSTIYASKDAFLADYEKVYDWVVEKTGCTPSLFRFPGGSNNGSSYVGHSIIDEMEKRGFQYFDWNVSSGDGSNLTTTSNIIDNICDNVGNVENPVVLMHDGKGKNATLSALPSVLEYLSNAGYEFRPLDKTVEPVHFR